MKIFPPLLADTARSILIGAIRLYQLTLSPFFGPCCRYTPSCSHYGAEAIARFGVWRGGWLTLLRVLRCNPWGGAGEDPVPEHWASNHRARHDHKSPIALNQRALTAERNRS